MKSQIINCLKQSIAITFFSKINLSEFPGCNKATST